MTAPYPPSGQALSCSVGPGDMPRHAVACRLSLAQPLHPVCQFGPLPSPEGPCLTLADPGSWLQFIAAETASRRLATLAPSRDDPDVSDRI